MVVIPRQSCLPQSSVKFGWGRKSRGREFEVKWELTNRRTLVAPAVMWLVSNEWRQ